MFKSAGLRLESFANAQQFLEALDPNQPACVLLELRLNGTTGLDLQERLKRDAPALPVVVLTKHGDVDSAVKALKAGAFDFMEKPFENEVLLERVRQALELNRKQRKLEGRRAVVAGRRALLTPREREVMELMVTGKTNKNIAKELKISPKTLDIHRAKVMQKMQAESVGQLVHMSLALRGT